MVAYVGESAGGKTASRAFFARLESDFTLVPPPERTNSDSSLAPSVETGNSLQTTIVVQVRDVWLPTWPNCYDRLHIYHRAPPPHERPPPHKHADNVADEAVRID